MSNHRVLITLTLRITYKLSLVYLIKREMRKGENALIKESENVEKEEEKMVKPAGMGGHERHHRRGVYCPLERPPLPPLHFHVPLSHLPITLHPCFTRSSSFASPRAIPLFTTISQNTSPLFYFFRICYKNWLFFKYFKYFLYY